MGQRKCGVCEEAEFKYKCPNLVGMFQEAQSYSFAEIPCEKPIPSSEGILASIPALYVDKPMYVDEPSEELKQSQLESIASSNEICEALRSEELRKLICNIDSSPEPDFELEKAMQKEEFYILTQKILSIINP